MLKSFYEDCDNEKNSMKRFVWMQFSWHVHKYHTSLNCLKVQDHTVLILKDE